MRKLTITLAPRYRLTLSLSKRRAAAEWKEPFIPSLELIRNIRSGSRVSRFFRYIFQHNHIKRILGSNIALAILASSLLPTHAQLNEVEAEQNMITVNKIHIATERNLRFPVDTIQINQGYRIFHPGIDFEGITGDPVWTFAPGVVQNIQHSRFAYGNAVIVDHGKGITSLYAHLSIISVKEGDSVDTFTKIGEVGSTGRSTGDHLHFEIRDEGRAINPLSILPSY